MIKNFKVSNDIFLVKVIPVKEHENFLYELLKNREKKISISHEKLPSFYQHKKFLRSSPYRHWFIIKKGSSLLGSTYITKSNCVAIHLLKNNKELIIKIISFIIRTFKPLKELPSIRRKEFIMNITSNNRLYAEILKQLGGKKVQETFALKQKN